MKKLNKNIICWCSVFGLYALFILIFSYLYPYGADEYFYTYKCQDLADVFTTWFSSYNHNNPRIGLIINNIVLFNGKWLFLILNPLMQTIIALSIFILVYGKMPDMKSLNKLPAFALIAIMSVFLVVQPDNTLFWIGGACNYSWSILPFLWLLIFLKRIYQTKNIPQFSNLGLASLFFASFALGMTNENNSLAAVLILICFIFWCLKAKIKIRSSIYIILLGTIAGSVLLFSAPGSYERAAHPLLSFFNEATLLQKAIWHYPKIHDLIIKLFFIPLIVPLFLALEIYSSKTKALENDFFFSSAFAFLTACFLAAVLAGAPILSNTRAFYSASVMMIISFISMLEYFEDVYKIKLIRYIIYPAVIFVIFIMPVFSLQYIYLYKFEANRTAYIQKVKEQGKEKAFLDFSQSIDMPLKNLKISYYDVLLDANADKLLGIPIEITNPSDNQLNMI